MNDVKKFVSSFDGKLGKQHAQLHPIPVTDVWKQVNINIEAYD